MKTLDVGISPTLLAGLILALLTGCSRDAVPTPVEEAEPSDRLRVVALAPTATWLLSEISGPGIAAYGLWAENADGPPSDELERLLEADLIVRHGAGLDRWADTLELDAARVVDLSEGADLIEREGTRHSHGDQGEHTHAEPLHQTWHDPSLALRALETLERELKDRGEWAIDRNALDSLRGRLEALDTRLDRLAAATSAVSADDDLAYLARRLAAESSEDGSTLQLATTPSEAGALVLEGLLPPPEDSDYLALLERNLERLSAALTLPSP